MRKIFINSTLLAVFAFNGINAGYDQDNYAKNYCTPKSSGTVVAHSYELGGLSHPVCFSFQCDGKKVINFKRPVQCYMRIR